nr:M48 family peptidase [Gammaproteobacteria bacterium]
MSEHLTATLCLPVSPAYAPVNAMSGASGIRCDSDLQRYNTLLAHSEVKRVRDRIQRIEEKRDGPGTRRHLLATSVRLSRSMAGDLHKMADHCVERLAINTPLELYAYASPQSNAACFRPEDGRVFIMFSSHLLENFDPAELMFVMGHELGHHVYQHHNIPIGYIVRGKAPPAADLALQLFTWSRYAEISADRAGAYCADDLHSVARALFKLASGITGEGIVKFDMKAFMGQVDEMVAPDGRPGQDAPMQDWFSTHPFSPLRVKALKQFHESSLMQDGGFDK